MNLKRLFPIEVNFLIKNFFSFIKKENIKESIENLHNEKKTIFYLDAPTYDNLGDQAIALAINKFINDNFINYNFIEISEKNVTRNLKYLKKVIKKEDIIILSGGGNFGDFYPRYEAIRRLIIKHFTNKIIIFPQTFDYSNTRYGKKEVKKSLKFYNKSYVYLCAREQKSYEIMKKLYKNVFLVPDIVFYLKKAYQNKQNTNKNDLIGICLRNDKESLLNINERKMLISLVDDKYKIYLLDTISDVKEINNINREKILMKKMMEFKQCNLILTDRLHGMIFSILNNKPCLFVDNLNNKISGVYDIIKDKVINIYNISNSNDKEITELIKQNINKETSICVDNLYGELVDLFKN